MSTILQIKKVPRLAFAETRMIGKQVVYLGFRKPRERCVSQLTRLFHTTEISVTFGPPEHSTSGLTKLTPKSVQQWPNRHTQGLTRKGKNLFRCLAKRGLRRFHCSQYKLVWHQIQFVQQFPSEKFRAKRAFWPFILFAKKQWPSPPTRNFINILSHGKKEEERKRKRRNIARLKSRDGKLLAKRADEYKPQFRRPWDSATFFM